MKKVYNQQFQLASMIEHIKDKLDNPSTVDTQKVADQAKSDPAQWASNTTYITVPVNIRCGRPIHLQILFPSFLGLGIFFNFKNTT